ncbi:MAG: hypothetical protein E7673_02270 [Ruminococcaceae bacterium]|nr:hypothetical protein [Oscillospiraceae bacterium]
MKKITCFILIIVFVCVGFTSCRKYTKTGENSYILKTLNTCSVRGIENFSKVVDSDNLCENLLPSDFLEKYNYIDGDYYLYVRFRLIYKPQKNISKALMYLTYDDETYLEAKKDVLSWDLDFENIHQIGGYLFYQNTELFSSQVVTEVNESSEKPNKVLPRGYTMIGYNDDKKTIVFFGKIDENEMTNSFEDHIREYYGEWYEFS